MKKQIFSVQVETLSIYVFLILAVAFIQHQTWILNQIEQNHRRKQPNKGENNTLYINDEILPKNWKGSIRSLDCFNDYKQQSYTDVEVFAVPFTNDTDHFYIENNSEEIDYSNILVEYQEFLYVQTYMCSYHSVVPIIDDLDIDDDNLESDIENVALEMSSDDINTNFETDIALPHQSDTDSVIDNGTNSSNSCIGHGIGELSELNIDIENMNHQQTDKNNTMVNPVDVCSADLTIQDTCSNSTINDYSRSSQADEIRYDDPGLDTHTRFSRYEFPQSTDQEQQNVHSFTHDTSNINVPISCDQEKRENNSTQNSALAESRKYADKDTQAASTTKDCPS